MTTPSQTGKVLSKKDSTPLGGIIVRGYTDKWETGINTFTNKDGEFKIYTNDKVTHFEISGFGFENVKLNRNPDYIEEFPNKRLAPIKAKYETVSFKEFILPYDSLHEENTPQDKDVIFNFDSTKFDSYKFKANLPIIYLDSLNF